MSLTQDMPAAVTAGSASAYATSNGRRSNPLAVFGAESYHLEALERAVTVALSPLDYPDPAAWGDALTRALCSLVQAPGPFYCQATRSAGVPSGETHRTLLIRRRGLSTTRRRSDFIDVTESTSCFGLGTILPVPRRLPPRQPRPKPSEFVFRYLVGTSPRSACTASGRSGPRHSRSSLRCARSRRRFALASARG